MRLTRVTVLAVLASSFLIACSKDDKDLSTSYDYTQNGCATGKHTFTASSDGELREKLCTALADDGLNKGCALGMRMARFSDDCEGTAAYKKLNTPADSTSEPVTYTHEPSATPKPSGNKKPSNSRDSENEERKFSNQLFEASLAAGDQRWSPRSLTLEIEKTDRSGTSRTETNCLSRTTIKLNGRYPTLRFSMGTLSCRNQEAEEAAKKLTQIMNSLDYSVRRIPLDSDFVQFGLKIERAPVSFRPLAGHRVVLDNPFERFGSLNALITSEQVFLDMIMTTEAPIAVADGKVVHNDRATYYMEVVLLPKNGRLSTIEAKLTTDHQGIQTTTKLTGDLR